MMSLWKETALRSSNRVEIISWFRGTQVWSDAPFWPLRAPTLTCRHTLLKLQIKAAVMLWLFLCQVHRQPLIHAGILWLSFFFQNFYKEKKREDIYIR